MLIMSREPSKALLTWYDENRRDLPWRRTHDPYVIWVSEIMLQQTRVETVLPYFRRFVQQYPSVESLARAEEEDVLGLWAGLGYYRRARLLHAAARQVVTAGGGIPQDIRGLRKLSGVGAYTAAAIGSIAFGLVEPAVDGNVERVIARYRGIGDSPKKAKTKREIAETARQLLSRDRPGDSNQALIELGATLCRPRNPRCLDCPLLPDCHAAGSGEAPTLPAPRARRAPVRVDRQVAVVLTGGRVLLFRRPRSSTLLAGMWELPWTESEESRMREAQLEERYGGHWSLGESIGQVSHAITHRQFRVQIFVAQIATDDELTEGQEAGWFTPRDLDNLPVSSLVRKVLALAAWDSAALAGGK